MTQESPLHGGRAPAPAAYEELVTPSIFADGAEHRQEKSFRGALWMGLKWAAGGALLGFGMEVVDPHGEIADIWPSVLAVPGFFAGLIYYGVR